MLDGPGDPPMVHVPEGLQFGPTGGHVDRDQRRAIPAGGRLPAMQDQIALERSRCDAGPLVPRAEGALGPEGGEGRREAARLAGAPPTQRPELPVQGGRTGAGERRVHERLNGPAVAGGQGGEQDGEDRAQELAGEWVAGQPGRLENRGQLGGHILHRAPRRPARGAGGLPQAPNGGLAVTAGGPAVLIEQSAPLLTIGLLIAGAHHRGIFSTRALGHGGPLPVRNLVTPVLRQPLALR
jgi:hypothetical protein